MIVTLKEVRIAFPALFEPKAVGAGAADDAGTLRFSAVFPIEPGSDNCTAIEQAIAQVATAAWKDKAKAIMGELNAKGRVCYRRAPLSKDGVVYEGFEEMYTLNASDAARPTVVDRNRHPLTAKDGVIYSGCVVHVKIDIWAQNNSWGKRINGSLKGVQFVRDAAAFGGAVRISPDDFDDLGSLEAGAHAPSLAGDDASAGSGDVNSFF